MNIYVLMSCGLLFGIILHSLKTIRDINKRIDQANFKMVFMQYWSNEIYSLLVSVVCSAILLFVASEFINLPKIDSPDTAETLKEKLFHFNISNFIKSSSVISGYFADSIVYGFMGVSENKIKKQFADATPKID